MRCYRCNACQSQWDTKPCEFCGFPGADIRTPEQIKQDELFEKEMRGEYEDD